MKILEGHALDLLTEMPEKISLLATDPPYAFGGSGGEHALSATVATCLREYGKRVESDGWAIVFCASSWRSTTYMVEALRGVMDPVRMGTWVKPEAKTKVNTSGWAWATVNVLVFRKKRGKVAEGRTGKILDWIECPPVTGGRRAELPSAVCDWAVSPYVWLGGWCVDPFAGSGALLAAAERYRMNGIGCEISP